MELDGPLFFGSADGLLDEMERLAQDTRYVILDFRRVNDVEMSGAGMVHAYRQDVPEAGDKVKPSRDFAG